MNGSDRLGGCRPVAARVETFNDGATRILCTFPPQLVIFDKIWPRLTNLGGMEWARGFLTLRAPSVAAMNFDLRGRIYDSISRIEVIMFNCPWWGIGAEAITLYIPASSHAIGGTNLVRVTPTIASCNSLVRVCIPCTRCNNTERALGLEFYTGSLTSWIHLAEVMLKTDDGSCPPDIVITRSTPVINICDFPGKQNCCK